MIWVFLEKTVGYFLDEDKFSSVSVEQLWEKLRSYVVPTIQKTDNANFLKDQKRIEISSSRSSLNPFIKLNDTNNPLIEKSMIRVAQLNVTFDKESKGLSITDENTENFPYYNTLSYQFSCGGKSVSKMNSLFFHESSLVDYTKNFDKDDYLACQTYLMIVTFTNMQSISDGNSTKEKRINDMIYVCYDKSTNKIVENDFPILNQNASINVSDFISSYNNSALSELTTNTVESDGKTIVNNYSNFKSAVSMFKLIHENELEFINFRSYNTIAYDRFIENLKSQLTGI